MINPQVTMAIFETMRRSACILFALVILCVGNHSLASDFEKANAILTKYCAGCHNADDANGEFALDSFESLIKGGESGQAITPGGAASSRMVAMMRGKLEPAMPPAGEATPTADEIQTLVDWIDSGAIGPDGRSTTSTSIDAPKIESNVKTSPVTALAFSPDEKTIAIGRFGRIEFQDTKTGQIKRTIDQLPGKINDLAYCSDGRKIYAATGIVGVYGEVLNIDCETGETLGSFRGHRDIVYSVELNADESQLVTAGYDRKAICWDLKSGEQVTEFVGHNGGVFSATFDPTTSVIATASSDSTVKIWNAKTGQRLDTRSEPLKEQYCVVFDSEGEHFFGAGADNRIRKWKFASVKQAKINPIQVSRFAHESAIQQLEIDASGRWLVSVAQDASIKIWDAKSLTELHSFSQQAATVLSMSLSNSKLALGRSDGVVDLLDWPKLESVSRTGNTPLPQSVLPSSATSENVLKLKEQEPNDELEQAVEATVPFQATGTIDAGDRTDVDLYGFKARQGEQWVLEIKAARDKSPLDSHISILDGNGDPVPQVVLQAVRDSYFTFRGKNSTQNDDFRLQNWEEMQIGQFLYCNGEVVKLYHYPRGPDSGFNVFPNFNNRHTWFGTTALTHALNEPCYIVESFPPGTPLVQSGLPKFDINFENDDDPERELGKDSRFTFTAPNDGDYFVKVRDSRDFQGTDFKYELNVRRPKPSFAIRKLMDDKLKIVKGGYKKIGIEVDRIDGYDKDIDVSIENLPAGFWVAGPTTVESGQVRAWFTIYAGSEAESAAEGKLPNFSAVAKIGDRVVRHEKKIGQLEVVDKKKLRVHLEGNVTAETEIPVIEIYPGQTVTTKLRVDRINHASRINFGKENAGINFPFGVYVDNIGLNGVLIPPQETERKIFITAETFVKPGERLVFLEAEEADRPASNPAILRVVAKKIDGQSE